MGVARGGASGGQAPRISRRRRGCGRRANLARKSVWPDALEALTGERQMDATAMADYFAPLKTWLDEQNKGTKIGW